MSKLLNLLSNIPRSVKGVLLLCVDAVILGFSMLMAFAVRFAPSAPHFDPASLDYQLSNLSYAVFTFIGLQLLFLFISGLYRSVLRHAGPELLVILLRSILIGTGLFALIDFTLEGYRMPLSITAMSATFAFLTLFSIRLMIRRAVRLHILKPLNRKNYNE